MVDSHARTKQSKAYKQGEGFMEWALLPYKRYAEFTGRSRRMEYWSYMLFWWVITITMVLIGSAAGGDPENWGKTPVGTITMGIFTIWVLASCCLVCWVRYRS
jgi:uncharacterized membrane protein YhaH (DUF805 family)